MSLEPLETAQDAEYNGCRQLSIFLENRLGQLLRLTRILDTADIHILGLTVEGSVECAIVRLIVNKPDEAHTMISEGGFALTETELIVVELPPGQRGILAICAALISAEVNISYSYPVFPSAQYEAGLAIQVDNLAQAASVLRSKRFNIFEQGDLR